MGMEVRLVLYAPSQERGERAARAAYDQVAALDGLLSSYRTDSELMEVNRHGKRVPVQVGGHLFSILKRAQGFSRQSEGALDVTAGPLVKLWREARRTHQLPSSATRQEAKGRMGWQHLSLNDEDRTVTFLQDGMLLNLGGLAKGYILDRALEVLAEHGITCALVEAGGDLVTGASPPGQEGWRVDIPHDVPGSSDSEISVSHSAVSTSGDAVQHVEIGDTRYSHVINPQTGLGLTEQPTTTVVAPRGIAADAVATTVGILGVQKGRTFVRSYYPGTTAYATHAGMTRLLQKQ